MLFFYCITFILSLVSLCFNVYSFVWTSIILFLHVLDLLLYVIYFLPNRLFLLRDLLAFRRRSIPQSVMGIHWLGTGIA